MRYEQVQNRHREDQSVKRAKQPVEQGYQADYGYHFPHLEVSKEVEESTAETLEDIDRALGLLAIEAA